MSDDNLAGAVDEMWHLVAGTLVFLMQPGFAMLEAGSVGSKNTLNILFKNLCDACISAIGFWLLGYGIAYGECKNGFIGTKGGFALSDDGFHAGGSSIDDEEAGAYNYHTWFFQWAFAATAATIVSGSVAERCKLDAYYVYSFIISVFIYPIVVCWCWGYGWLSPFGLKPEDYLFDGVKSNNYIDFAGSGVVHMVGGLSGLVGAIMLGARKGRFGDDGKVNDMPGHNIAIALLGTLILWVGWYGFNAGSTLAISGGASKLASKVATTTTIAAAAAGSTMIILQKVFLPHHDLMLVSNAILAGLVSITAPCALVEPWAAMMIGIIGCFAFFGFSKFLHYMKIDDPLDAAPIHGFCGFWGVMAVGIFGTDKNAAYAGYVGSLYAIENDKVGPLESGEQFGVQLVAGLCITAWTVVTAGLMFFLISQTIGLRVSEEVEDEGLDSSEHGGRAYIMVTGTGSTQNPVKHTGDNGDNTVKVLPEKESA